MDLTPEVRHAEETGLAVRWFCVDEREPVLQDESS
jgi:hypothetical protein